MRKVQLHFPLNVSDSSYYKNLINHPPEGYNYISKTRSGLIGNTVKREVFRLVKSITRNLLSSFGLSRPLYSRPVKKSSEFVHHFAHCIPKKINFDYVVDIEGVWQLAIGDITPKVKKKILNILSKDNCKSIMPWTNYAYEEFIAEFPELKHKTNLLRPAVKLNKNVIVKNNNKTFTMLYVARDFKLKNGELACDIMNTFIKHYKSDVNIKAIVISNTPDNIKNNYPNIIFKDLMPQEELYKYYEMSDIVVYPSPIDTFGFSIIEAMSFGVPSIAMKTVHTKSVDEIIVNDFNGFCFNENEYVEKFVDTIIRLIINNDELYNISNNCIFTISNGPYSLHHRNNNLKKILDKCTTK